MSDFSNIHSVDQHTNVAMVESILKTNNITIPERTKRDYFQHPGYPSIKQLALEEVANGRDPLDSEEVRKALARTQLDQVFHQHNEVQALESSDAYRHYVKHWDQISSDLIARFNEAVNTLTHLIDKHPKLSISSGTPGSGLIVPYAHAVEANENATQTADALSRLRRILNPQESKPGAYWHLNPTYTQVKEHNITAHNGVSLSMFDTLKAGISVEYAEDYQEANTRAETIAEQRREEQRRREAEREENSFHA
ncbi:hypothetical protein [Brevibacterium linens]|uniref:hypothetical protein n=1 Tax=Brevibacterium linens TaxID=1703 RepID=UPI003BF4F85B